MAQNDRDQQKVGATQQGSQQGSQQGTQQGTQQGAQQGAQQGSQGAQPRQGSQGIQTSTRPGERTGGLARRGVGAGLGMPSTTASPFALVRRMMEDMDRMFGGLGLPTERMFGDLMSMEEPMRESMRMWSPPLEVLEEQGQLVVRAELPGIKKEDIRIDLQDDMLTISGERRSERKEEREGFFRSERSYGRFERSIRVPEGIDPASCDARFDSGILELKMKLPTEQARGRQIPIRASGNGG